MIDFIILAVADSDSYIDAKSVSKVVLKQLSFVTLVTFPNFSLQNIWTGKFNLFYISTLFVL